MASPTSTSQGWGLSRSSRVSAGVLLFGFILSPRFLGMDRCPVRIYSSAAQYIFAVPEISSADPGSSFAAPSSSAALRGHTARFSSRGALWRLTGGFGPGLGHCGARVGDCWGRFCLPWSGEPGISSQASLVIRWAVLSTARALLLRLNRSRSGHPGAGLVRSVPGRSVWESSPVLRQRTANRRGHRRRCLSEGCCFHSGTGQLRLAGGPVGSRSWDDQPRSRSQTIGAPTVQNPNPLYTIGTNHSFILLLKVPFRVEVSVD